MDIAKQDLDRLVINEYNFFVAIPKESQRLCMKDWQYLLSEFHYRSALYYESHLFPLWVPVCMITPFM